MKECPVLERFINAIALVYDRMKRFTVSIPKHIKEKMDEFPEVNWPVIIKTGILKKLNQVKKLEGEGEI